MDPVNNVGAYSTTDTITCFKNQYLDAMDAELSRGRQTRKPASNNDYRWSGHCESGARFCKCRADR